MILADEIAVNKIFKSHVLNIIHRYKGYNKIQLDGKFLEHIDNLIPYLGIEDSHIGLIKVHAKDTDNCPTLMQTAIFSNTKVGFEYLSKLFGKDLMSDIVNDILEFNRKTTTFEDRYELNK